MHSKQSPYSLVRLQHRQGLLLLGQALEQGHLLFEQRLELGLAGAGELEPAVQLGQQALVLRQLVDLAGSGRTVREKQ